ncbi:ATP-binding cassette domain-containing protein [Methylomonas sp. AM2-LC]|uniref:ABC transporter ATP-binding protein n=1 Tax=Methylomonas sp. AM2-LC TaxID=3153301 RepID=UPI003266510B
MTNPVTPLLTIKGLQFNGNTAAKPLLEILSLSIQAGDRISLQGGSGAGKSLLLRSITQLEKVDKGEFIWKGKDLQKIDMPLYRSHVIYLHQLPALGAGSVADSLQQVFKLKTHKGKQYSELIITNFLTEIGLNTAFLQKNIQNLSGGEAQITALLRAIQLQPEILLLDEPTAALDAEKSAAIEKIVACWFAEATDSRAYIWVTHNPAQAARVSNKVWKMEQGRLTIA